MNTVALDVHSVRPTFNEAGIAKNRIRAASYWRKATPNSTERFEQ